MKHDADGEPTQSDQREPGSSPRYLHQALLDLQTRCFRLAAALAVGLPVEIEAAASELAAAWFEATAAIKAAHHGPDGKHDAEYTGVLALRTTHQVLFDLFELAPPLPASEAPQLRAVLCRLSSRIGHALAALAAREEGGAPAAAEIGGSGRSADDPEAPAAPAGTKPVFRVGKDRRPIAHVFRSRRF